MELLTILGLDNKTFWTTIGAALLGGLVGSIATGLFSSYNNRILIQTQHQNDLSRDKLQREVDMLYRAIVTASLIQVSIWRLISKAKETVPRLKVFQ